MKSTCVTKRRTTVLASCFSAILMTGTLAAFGSAAKADTFKFYNGTSYPSGEPYYGSAAYNAINGNGMTCPTAGTCLSDNTRSSLSFTSNGGSNISLTVSANGTNGVWGDFAPNYGGLGVSSPGYTVGGAGVGDDQIDSGQSLAFNFGTAVNLIGVLTLFDRAHTPFAGNSLTGDITINGITVSLANANGDNLGGLFNNITTLVLALGPNYNGSTGDPEYYVSGLVVTPVPLPAALPLFATGLGALGLLGWRKKRKNAAAVVV
jgi:hypothetical protein